MNANQEWYVYDSGYNSLQEHEDILVFTRDPESGESYDIAKVVIGDGMSIQDVINNANVISAAPTMYDVLKAISAYKQGMDTFSNDDEMLNAIAEVVAKAEGA